MQQNSLDLVRLHRFPCAEIFSRVEPLSILTDTLVPFLTQLLSSGRLERGTPPGNDALQKAPVQPKLLFVVSRRRRLLDQGTRHHVRACGARCRALPEVSPERWYFFSESPISRDVGLVARRLWFNHTLESFICYKCRTHDHWVLGRENTHTVLLPWRGASGTTPVVQSYPGVFYLLQVPHSRSGVWTENKQNNTTGGGVVVVACRLVCAEIHLFFSLNKLAMEA